MYFEPLLSNSRTSLEAYIDFKFHLSKHEHEHEANNVAVLLWMARVQVDNVQLEESISN
jgi:hypothetical protein